MIYTILYDNFDSHTMDNFCPFFHILIYKYNVYCLTQEGSRVV